MDDDLLDDEAETGQRRRVTAAAALRRLADAVLPHGGRVERVDPVDQADLSMPQSVTSSVVTKKKSTDAKAVDGRYQVVDGGLGGAAAHFAEETVVGDQQQRAARLGRAETVRIDVAHPRLPLATPAAPILLLFLQQQPQQPQQHQQRTTTDLLVEVPS